MTLDAARSKIASSEVDSAIAVIVSQIRIQLFFVIFPVESLVSEQASERRKKPG